MGKTALAEGLALRMAAGEVPPALRGKRLFSLELGLLVADTKYRGEFEERLRTVLDELDNSTILFIDEIHTLVGAGSAEGGIDAANLLKPALARGRLQCIGATTLAEYRKHIEKDAALERRFQPLLVGEPTPQATVAILRALAPAYAAHHGVANYSVTAAPDRPHRTGRTGPAAPDRPHRTGRTGPAAPDRPRRTGRAERGQSVAERATA